MSCEHKNQQQPSPGSRGGNMGKAYVQRQLDRDWSAGESDC